MARTNRVAAAMLVAGALACSREAPKVAEQGRRERRVVATFSGRADAATGTVTIETSAAGHPGALTEIPIVQDGTPGSGPRDTVELQTISAGILGNGCAAPSETFQGIVRLRSFYEGFRLANVHVEIVQMAPSGREACTGVTVPPEGTSNAHGLFWYGDLIPLGWADTTWDFRLPDRTAFTFTGRVMADLVDELPPVTTASVASGAHDGPLEVALTCADAGSGCAETRYAIYSLETGTWSPEQVYTGPFVVEGSAEVAIYSFDRAGNWETPHPETYFLRPKVLSARPADGAVRTSSAPLVEVEFSTRMNIVDLRVDGPGGPVPGSLERDPEGRAFTFVPAFPLEPGAVHTVTVGAGSDDFFGTSLGTPFAATFRTAPAPIDLRADTHVRPTNRAVARDGQDRHLYVWAASTGTGEKLFYSIRQGTTFVGPTRLLATVPAAGAPIPARAAVLHDAFAVAYALPDGGQVAVIDAATGEVVRNPNTFTGPRAAGQFELAGHESSGDIAVVDADPVTGRVTLRVLPLAGIQKPLVYDVYEPGAQAVSVAAVDRAFVAAWAVPGVAVRGLRFERDTRSFSSRTYLGSTLVRGEVAVAGDPAQPGALVAFTRGSEVWATMDLPSGPTAPARLGLACPSAGGVAASANGPTFGLAWINTAGGVCGARFVGGYWEPETAVFDPPPEPDGLLRDLAVASYQDRFAAVALMSHPVQADRALLNPMRTSPIRWEPPYAVQVDDWGDYANPALARDGEVTWDAHWPIPDTESWDVAIRQRVFQDGWTGPASVVSPKQPGGVLGVQLARGAAGEVMAVWAQQDQLGPSVFASLRGPAGWGPSVRLAERADSPVVAYDGTTFLAAWHELAATRPWDPWGERYEAVRAATFDGVAWTPLPPAYPDDGSSPAVASDGSGFLLVWLEPDGLPVMMRRVAGLWYPPSPVPGSQPGSSSLRMAGSSVGYGLTWIRPWGDGFVPTGALLAFAESGDTVMTQALGWGGPQPVPAHVAASAAGIAFAYRDGGMWSGAVWRPDGFATSFPLFVEEVAGIGSDGTGFAFAGAWVPPSGPVSIGLAEWHDAGSNAWLLPHEILPGWKAIGIASDGHGYELLAGDTIYPWEPPTYPSPLARTTWRGPEAPWPSFLGPLAPIGGLLEPAATATFLFDGEAFTTAYLLREADDRAVMRLRVQ
jgi:hypothetical protein